MADISSTTELSGPVDVVFQQTLLRNAKPRCVYFVGGKEGDVLASHSGTFTVKWRRYDNLDPTTTAISEDTGTVAYPIRTGEQASVTDLTATLLKYGSHLVLTEEANLINYTNQADGLVTIIAIQAGRSLNRLQRNELEDNATLKYASAGTADGDVTDAIGTALLRYSVNRLDRNSALTFTPETTGNTNIGTAPIMASYWLLCHSDVASDITALTGFQKANTYANQTQLEPGEFGFYPGAGIGIRCISSPEGSIDADLGGDPSATLRSTTGAKADLYTTIVMGMEAHGCLSLDAKLIKEVYMAGDKIPGIILINHAKGSAGAADPLSEISTMGWKAWHAAEILNADWIGGIRTGATKLE